MKPIYTRRDLQEMALHGEAVRLWTTRKTPTAFPRSVYSIPNRKEVWAVYHILSDVDDLADKVA